MKRSVDKLTLREVKEQVLRMKPGDVYEYQKGEVGETELITLDKIYGSTVQFHNEKGTMVTLNYFDAMNANLVKPANFDTRNNDMELDDMAETFNNM